MFLSIWDQHNLFPSSTRANPVSLPLENIHEYHYLKNLELTLSTVKQNEAHNEGMWNLRTIKGHRPFRFTTSSSFLSTPSVRVVNEITHII